MPRNPTEGLPAEGSKEFHAVGRWGLGQLSLKAERLWADHSASLNLSVSSYVMGLLLQSASTEPGTWWTLRNIDPFPSSPDEAFRMNPHIVFSRDLGPVLNDRRGADSCWKQRGGGVCPGAIPASGLKEGSTELAVGNVDLSDQSGGNG